MRHTLAQISPLIDRMETLNGCCIILQCVKTFSKRISRHWMVKESCGTQSSAARALFCKQSTQIAALFEVKPPPEDSEELRV